MVRDQIEAIEQRDQALLKLSDLTRACLFLATALLAAWLAELHIELVVMESTGIYWIPLYEILEARGLEVLLVNARHVKNVPGRKSDVQECQWLLKLHTFGLLNNSFQPTHEIRIALHPVAAQRESGGRSRQRDSAHAEGVDRNEYSAQ